MSTTLYSAKLVLKPGEPVPQYWRTDVEASSVPLSAQRGREILEAMLTEREFQDLDDTLHNYRTWPAGDVQGVSDRFEEVLDLIAKLMLA